MSLKEALFDNQFCFIKVLVTEMQFTADFEACLRGSFPVDLQLQRIDL